MNHIIAITPIAVSSAAEEAATANIDELFAETRNPYKDGFITGTQWLATRMGEFKVDNSITINGIIRLCNMTGSMVSYAHEITLKASIPKLVQKYSDGQRRWGVFAATKLKEQEKAVRVMERILKAGVSMEVANEINAYLSEIEPVTDEEKNDLHNEGMQEASNQE